MKFSAWCRWCNLRILWSTSRRTWDRSVPNKTYDDPTEQTTRCPQSKGNGYHDPDPKRT